MRIHNRGLKARSMNRPPKSRIHFSPCLTGGKFYTSIFVNTPSYSPFGETILAQDIDNSGWVNHNIHTFSSKPILGGSFNRCM